MSQFDESKVARGGDGKFAEKPPAPEADGIELGETLEGMCCAECGGEMVVEDDGVSHHLTSDGDIDHEADAEHVALDDGQYEPDVDDVDEDALREYATNRIPDGERGQDPDLENRLRNEEENGIYRCTGCGREEGECSADPCEDVIADRGEDEDEPDTDGLPEVKFMLDGKQRRIYDDGDGQFSVRDDEGNELASFDYYDDPMDEDHLIARASEVTPVPGYTPRNQSDFKRTWKRVGGDAEKGEVVQYQDMMNQSTHPQEVIGKSPMAMPQHDGEKVTMTSTGPTQYQLRDLVTGRESEDPLTGHGWNRVIDGRNRDRVWGSSPMPDPGTTIRTGEGTSHEVRRSWPVGAGIADTYCGDDTGGSLVLSRQRNEAIPEPLRSQDGVYPRDTGHSDIVAAYHPEPFRTEERDSASIMGRAGERVRRQFPDAYRQAHGGDE